MKALVVTIVHANNYKVDPVLDRNIEITASAY